MSMTRLSVRELQKFLFCDQLLNFCHEGGGGQGVHKNLHTDHQRDSFRNSYSNGFNLLERQLNNASEVA